MEGALTVFKVKLRHELRSGGPLAHSLKSKGFLPGESLHNLPLSSRLWGEHEDGTLRNDPNIAIELVYKNSQKISLQFMLMIEP